MDVPRIPDLSDLLRMPEMASIEVAPPAMPAKEFQIRIEDEIKRFLEDLNDERAQVQATVALPGGRQVIASWFGWHGDDMLLVHGFDERQRQCRVLVEYSAVHIVLTALDPQEKPVVSRPIGFQSHSEGKPPSGEGSR